MNINTALTELLELTLLTLKVLIGQASLTLGGFFEQKLLPYTDLIARTLIALKGLLERTLLP